MYMFFSMANVNDTYIYVQIFIFAKHFHFNSSRASAQIAYWCKKFSYCRIKNEKRFLIHIFTFKNVKLGQNNQTISNMDFFS